MELKGSALEEYAKTGNEDQFEREAAKYDAKIVAPLRDNCYLNVVKKQLRNEFNKETTENSVYIQDKINLIQDSKKREHAEAIYNCIESRIKDSHKEDKIKSFEEQKKSKNYMNKEYKVQKITFSLN